MLSTPFWLVVLNVVSGVHGALHTRAPKFRAICIMEFSTVVPPGAMRVRSNDNPRPVFVEKNMFATLELQVLRHAEEAPNPSILCRTLVQVTVEIPLVPPACTTASTSRSST